MASRSAVGASVLVPVLLMAGCQGQTTVQVPNRVLDRPLDVTLTCVRLDDDGTLSPLGVGDCAQDTRPSCTTDGPQLIGYVANSERNEVAIFRRCDATAAVVDVDPDAPGYQLVPVGQLPSEIESTTLGCRVITANAGSCDLTLLDGLGLAAIALQAAGAEQVAPSSLVSKLIPLRSDGLPLGARPGALLTAPRDLSTAISSAPDPVGGAGGFDDNECQDDARGSAWVTFPTCQLLAEVELSTGRLLQSRQFVTQPDGTVEVVDSGTDPDCPVDCPIQFPDGAPQTCSGADEDPADCRPASGLDGFFPNAVELVRPELYDPETDLGADSNLDYASLFVGGSGSDTLVELPFALVGGFPDGTWDAQALSLPLEDPQGIVRVRAAPPAPMADGDHQFLYVIGGDGATHVVDRAFEDNALGVECDTQIDPTTTSPPFPSCNPIDPTGGGQALAPDRRPFAAGPGIRVSGGAGFTDWAFFRVVNGTDTPGTPFGVPGIVGVGTTSFGRIVMSVFNQLADPTDNTSINTAVMDLSIPPHSLWPTEDPTTLSVDSTTLPAVEDEEPERALVGDVNSTQALAPTLRRIDLAYSTPPEDGFSEARIARSESLGNPSNADGLGLFEGDAVYANEAVRAVVRDYQQWAPVRWSLTWEGTIPGTRSATGRFECETPGWENGTCLLADGSPTEGARLVDESASFCDNGVLAGDKLVILGCGEDDDCGLGQRCLREPTAPSSAAGICVSQQAYEEEFEVLRQVCAPFINDACGTPRREYVVTRAFQDELHIQALDRPLESHLRAVDPETGMAPAEDAELSVVGLQEVVDRYTCELPNDPATVNQPSDGQGCSSDAQCTLLNGGSSGGDQGDEDDFVCAADGFCRGPCPLGDPECYECEVDTDCGHYGEGALCVNQQCQRPCEPGQRECVQALLPGPRCFAELVDYVVRTRDSFTVVGDPAPGFITTRVVVDPATGECRENEAESALLTSRLRLGSDQASVFNDPTVGIPDCPNPDEASPQDPNPCRIVARRSEGEGTLFHQMEYEGRPVSAIRFSTPSISLVLDLVDLLALASNVEVTDANGELYSTRYPTEFRQFNRARIPRNYATTFAATAGYIPISEPAIVGNTVMVYPLRIIHGPTANTAYVVDAGGRGGPAGVRGQIIRLFLQQIQQGGFTDTNFLVR